jgi:hypothetical protein
MASATKVSRARKGCNFTSDKERQVCRSVLHISQDPIQGNGQRKEAFWDCIAMHYNQNMPTWDDHRPSQSLETKWGVIKHDIAKFIGVSIKFWGIENQGLRWTITTMTTPHRQKNSRSHHTCHLPSITRTGTSAEASMLSPKPKFNSATAAAMERKVSFFFSSFISSHPDRSSAAQN